MKEACERIAKAFTANVRSVDSLIDFDQAILVTATSNLHPIIASLEEAGKVQAAKDVRNRLTAIENIRANDSMKRHYGTIFSQCVVLLVSYFASAVQDLFKAATAHAFASGVDVPITQEEVKLSWRDLAGQIGDLP
ncbi:MAG TPA: hypothetical protein VMU84_04570, partial [Thermoanaerobaculia bacterium]|nr:hypothetical protein [Thermoanaerobaculia bacterium]